MRIESKHQNKLSGVLLTFLFAAIGFASYADSIPSGFSNPLVWRLGAEVAPAWVPGTNGFLDGENPLGRNIRNNLSASLRAGFSFAPDTREGLLYKGLYQGIGLGYTTFYSSELLGTSIKVRRSSGSARNCGSAMSGSSERPSGGNIMIMKLPKTMRSSVLPSRPGWG